MSYNKNVVHEGAIKDIVDLILNNKIADSIDNLIKVGSGDYWRNIANKTSNLVLTFPVIADESVSLSTAKLMAKATERKVVTMLQMLFAAIDITNNRNAFDFIGKVHQNLTSDDVLSFINKMDAKNLKHENLDIDNINKLMIQCITEDTIELNNELPVSLNDSFSIVSDNIIIHEGKKGKGNNRNNNGPLTYNMNLSGALDKGWRDSAYKNKRKADRLADQLKTSKETIGTKDRTIRTMGDEIANLKRKISDAEKKIENEKTGRSKEVEKHKENARKELEKLIKEKEKLEEKLNGNKIQSLRTDPDFLSKQVLSTDIKKANDDVPSLLIVRFVTGSGEMQDKIVSQAVIGVKAKLIYVKQSDMVNRIITKNRDNNGLFNFLRATTGEISMIKDFLFAIDRAKLDTISSRNNSSPIWKLLERRYLVSKKNWLLRNSNGTGSAIAVLVISKETEDILNKEYGFKCEPYKMLDIMEAYSVMGFAIVDDVNEKVKSLYDDNSTQYEINSYSSYEREDKAQFKKMINLMTGAKEKL